MKKFFSTVSFCIFVAFSTSAKNYPIYATINGEQEVPSNTSPAQGSMTGMYNDVTNNLTYNIICNNLSSSILASHFHGNVSTGTNGAVKAIISPFTSNNTASGSITVSEADETALISGMWYINIHTSNYPSGEVRGQLFVPCRYTDSLALIALYDATNGPNWRKKTNWKSNRPLNEWYGIYTNTEGCVTCIDLDGTVNYTWSMDSLGNNLQGRLPDSLGNGNMTKLERLIVNGNQGLSSVLPPNFGQMPELLAFWANDCRFTTPFPNSFFTTPKLEDIDLTNNPLNTVPPSDFSLMPKLSGLILTNCGLYDKVPVSWSGKLWRRVQLENNKIDSFPNVSSFSNAPNCNCHDSTLTIQNNRATFDDIVPTLTNWRQIIPIVYAPQDFFYVDTTFRRNGFARSSPVFFCSAQG